LARIDYDCVKVRIKHFSKRIDDWDFPGVKMGKQFDSDEPFAQSAKPHEQV